MKHLDLFSGIGGFAYAVDQVWPNAEHIFCEIDPFCRQVLLKHWPNSKIYGDIKELTGLQVLDTIREYENKVQRGSKDVREGNEYSGNSQLLRDNQAGDVGGVESKEDEVQIESSVQTREPFLSGDESQRQGPESIGESVAERNSTKENSLRDMQGYGDIQGRKNKDSSSPPRLQQTIRSDMALPDLSSQLAQNQSGNQENIEYEIDLLTAGIPCQPASQAGKRRGTSDDRWLWPQTFRVIRETQPRFVILENVRGILTLESGLVFKSLLTELENCGYEARVYIIPAVSVNAPHRRDRIWFVAHRNDERRDDGEHYQSERHLLSNERFAEENKSQRQGRKRGSGEVSADASDTESGEPGEQTERQGREDFSRGDWEANWLEVATKFCVLDDGLPNRVAKLKALGNAIVPQVAIEIFKSFVGSGIS